VRSVRGEVPEEAIDDVYFDSYPMPTPIPGFLAMGAAKLKGNTRDSSWVGYRYAEAEEPYKGDGERIGFNCASCHGYKVSYEKSPGHHVTKVVGGLPNPQWSMKWTVLQTLTDKFEGIYTSEEGPWWASGSKYIAKDMLLYHMPAGTGEYNMVRVVGEASHTDNDYRFSPIAIPNVTNYMAIRRSLSHTESYVGFEGFYIHAELFYAAYFIQRLLYCFPLLQYLAELQFLLPALHISARSDCGRSRKHQYNRVLPATHRL